MSRARNETVSMAIALLRTLPFPPSDLEAMAKVWKLASNGIADHELEAFAKWAIVNLEACPPPKVMLDWVRERRREQHLDRVALSSVLQDEEGRLWAVAPGALPFSGALALPTPPISASAYTGQIGAVSDDVSTERAIAKLARDKRMPGGAA